MSGMHTATTDLTSTRVALSTSSIHLATSRRSYLASAFVTAVTKETYLVPPLFLSHSATVALPCQPLSVEGDETFRGICESSVYNIRTFSVMNLLQYLLLSPSGRGARWEVGKRSVVGLIFVR